MLNIVVTGASRGIGLAIAKRLAFDGYRVIGIARRPAQEWEGAAGSAGGGAFSCLPFDLGETDKIPDLAADIRQKFGPVYGLVNNAGIGTEGLLASMAVEDIERLVRLNTLSPIVLTKFIVRSMMAEGRGRVVNISSVVASTGFHGLSVYAATKASLLGFTRSLAREVGRANITVNAVAPGFIDTDLTASLGGEDRNRIIRRSALRRLPGADDVAKAVSFLVSDQAGNITGTVLTVDAGGTA